MTRGSSSSSFAVLLVVSGLGFQELGAAIATTLFPQAGPLGVVMLRLVFSAVLLAVIARPRLVDQLPRRRLIEASTIRSAVGAGAPHARLQAACSDGELEAPRPLIVPLH